MRERERETYDDLWSLGWLIYNGEGRTAVLEQIHSRNSNVYMNI